MDQTALALARLREEAKADKPTKPGHPASAASKPQMAHAVGGTGGRMSSAAVPPALTKRQKSG